MKNSWFKSLFVPILLIVCSGSAIADFQPQVVYGDDSCQDAAEIKDPQIRHLSESSVALIYAKNLKVSETLDWMDIVSKSFGDSMNLCPEEKYYEQVSAASCSGVLISPDTVLTAGHCIDNEADCEKYAFVFGYQLNSQRHEPKSIPSRQIYYCDKLIKKRNSQKDIDFALVRLNRNVENVEPVHFRKSGEVRLGEALVTIGYPMGIPKKVADGFVRKLRKKYIVTNLDVSAGNSGAGVFNPATGILEGILIEGEEDFEYDKSRKCNIVKHCADEGCEGESVLKITEVVPYLPK